MKAHQLTGAATEEAVRLCRNLSLREVRAVFREVDRTGVTTLMCSPLWAVQGTRPA